MITKDTTDWDPTLAANVIANCRQQIQNLRMTMPLNVALALGRADAGLAEAQTWLRTEASFGVYAGTKPNET